MSLKYAVVCRRCPKASTKRRNHWLSVTGKRRDWSFFPQALKLVIPGLVNTIIALFKDTSLVIIIGLFDLFSSVQQATVDLSGWACPPKDMSLLP
jgi:ABC-type amino acid transport system permease subunit